MKKYFPVKINNINSDLCVVNLLLSQNFHLKIPYSEFQIDIDSDFLKLSKNKHDDFFEIFQDDKINLWTHSNLYLGNLNIFSKENQHCICVFLDSNSKITTIVNPKNSNIKINSNQIIELVLFSKSNSHFNFEFNNINKIGYSVFENKTLAELYGLKLNQHHIWLKAGCLNFNNSNLFFSNDEDNYSCHIEVKNKVDKDVAHYVRKIKLVRKN